MALRSRKRSPPELERFVMSRTQSDATSCASADGLSFEIASRTRGRRSGMNTSTEMLLFRSIALLMLRRACSLSADDELGLRVEIKAAISSAGAGEAMAPGARPNRYGKAGK